MWFGFSPSVMRMQTAQRNMEKPPKYQMSAEDTATGMKGQGFSQR